MGKVTKIAYCDSTVNPIVGCAGCELTSPINYCYACNLVSRYAGLRGWPANFFEPQYFPGRLEQAMKWSPLQGFERSNKPWLNWYPRIVFLGDLADIFAVNAPDPMEWLAPMIERMGTSPHVWLLLTKRPARLVEFAERIGGFPSNFWLGTSITRQAAWIRAKTMQKLRDVSPLSYIWYSLEPLMGQVDLGESIEGDWVVVGGMSGKNAIAMKPDWARAIRDWCIHCEMPFFFKQWGRWTPIEETTHWLQKQDAETLDGQEWHQMPEVRSV